MPIQARPGRDTAAPSGLSRMARAVKDNRDDRGKLPMQPAHKGYWTARDRIDIEMVNVSSSNIDAYGYDPDRKVLRVLFLNGGQYDYFDVPPAVWRSWQRAASKGRFHYYNIRYAYVYRRHPGT